MNSVLTAFLVFACVFSGALFCMYIRRVLPKEHLREFMVRIRQLTPQNDQQRDLESQALQQTGGILKARWVLVEETTATIPTPFLVVLVCWLRLIFASFGLFASVNATAPGAVAARPIIPR